MVGGWTTIPMQPGTDSLNLGVAAGIFIYEMTRRARNPAEHVSS